MASGLQSLSQSISQPIDNFSATVSVACSSKPSTNVKQFGQCDVCHRLISLTSTGRLRKHGTGSGCSGYGQLPQLLSSSRNVYQQRLSKHPTGTSQIQQQDLPANDVTSTDLFDFSHSQQITASEDNISLLQSHHCRLLKRIPKASRSLAAGKLCSLLSAVNSNPDNITAWEHLLLFAKFSLYVPDGRGGQKHQASLSNKVNQIISAYPPVVFNKDLEHQKFVSRSNTRKSAVHDSTKLARRISDKIEDGDVRAAIRLASSDDCLVPINDATLNALRDQHPSRSITAASAWFSTSVSVADVNASVPLSVTNEDVVAAIRSFPNGSAGGIDGLRPQHLKEMISSQCANGLQLINCLTSFCNVVLDGKIPPAIQPVFCGASLFALSKKNGGIRPIAVGCTLRRLVAKVAARLVSVQAAELFHPHQLGVGVKHGTEAAVHATRCYLKHCRSFPSNAILKLDFSNAFNSVHRDVVLSAVHKFLPSLLKFTFSCYAHSSQLFFGDNIILSEEGTQQGDPLGPLLFCLSIHQLIQQLKSELNLWYIDDGTLGGDVQNLLSDVELIQSHGPPIGLFLNSGKCEIITDDLAIVHQVRQLLPDVIHIPSVNATLLGAPIGGSDITDTFLLTKVDELTRISERLKLLSMHDSFYLLKNCFTLPKLMYTLRVAPCFQSSILNQYDNVLRLTLQSTLNTVLTDSAWDQAKLPVKLGGIGILSARDVSLPAFIASVIGSASITTQLLPDSVAGSSGLNDEFLNQYINEWQLITGLSSSVVSQASEQRCWTNPLQLLASRRVLDAAPDKLSRARLLAASAQSSGAFLNAIPMSSIGTRLDDASMRIAVALRLGVTVCSPHLCVCGSQVDSNGIHGLSCRKSAGRLSRHNSINGIIKAALSSAEIPCRLEPRGIARDDGKRPDGVSTVPLHNGRCVVWDVTCPDTLAKSYVDKAVTGSGVVASLAESKKRQKYNNIDQHVYFFQPISVETFGAFGSDTLEFLVSLGKRLISVHNDSRASMFLFQRISIAVQRGNAACVMGTMEGSGMVSDLF
jgi:hypothetical protein